jgi:oxygen-independent coproporphyrinogen-3 oxidase
MTKLRLDTGIIAEELKMNWGIGQLSRIEKTISRHVDDQKVERTNSGWRLTDKGKFFADGIAADLFLV